MRSSNWFWVLLAVLAAQVLAQPLSKTHFFLQEGRHKCFIDDAAEGVPLTVTYHNHDNPGVPCAVLIKNPQGRTAASIAVDQDHRSGKLTHMTRVPGEHEICVACESAKWFVTSQLKWSLSVDVGDTEIDYEKMAKAKDVEPVKEILGQLQSRLSILAAENEYQRLQEAAFREAGDTVNRRIIFFSVLQIIVMVISTAAFYLFVGVPGYIFVK